MADDWTLHPILETSDSPNTNAWYVLSDSHDLQAAASSAAKVHLPCARLGQSLVSTSTPRLILFGGATLETVLNDTHEFDCLSFRWRPLKCSGKAPSARYDHAAAFFASTNQMVVFGGAQQDKVLNDVHVLNISSHSWTAPAVKGSPPSSRSLHMVASTESDLVVFGGGLQSSEPVADTRVHLFNVASSKWTAPACSGAAPSPRLGHSLVHHDHRLFVFGGMASGVFFGDLYVLDMRTWTWSCPDTAGPRPCPRSGHAAAMIGARMYVFGGLGLSGNQPASLSDIFVLDTATMEWAAVPLSGSAIGARLDHAMCAGALHPLLASAPKPVAAAPAPSAPIQDITEMFGSRGVLLCDAMPAEAGEQTLPPASDSHESQGASDGAAEANTNSAEEEKPVPEASDGGQAAAAARGNVPALFVYGGVSLEGNVFGDLVVLAPQ